jgi:hypothetical protein
MATAEATVGLLSIIIYYYRQLFRGVEGRSSIQLAVTAETPRDRNVSARRHRAYVERRFADCQRVSPIRNRAPAMPAARIDFGGRIQCAKRLLKRAIEELGWKASLPSGMPP